MAIGRLTTESLFVQYANTAQPALFEELYARLAAIVSAESRCIAGPGQDAEDLDQGFWLLVLSGSLRFEANRRLSPWIGGVLRNRWRTEQRRRRSDPKRLPSRGFEASASEVAAVNDIREVVESRIAALPARYRNVVRLSLLDQLSHAEISALTGHCQSSVATKLHRGLQRLQASLQGAIVALLAAIGIRGTAHAHPRWKQHSLAATAIAGIALSGWLLTHRHDSDRETTTLLLQSSSHSAAVAIDAIEARQRGLRTAVVADAVSSATSEALIDRVDHVVRVNTTDGAPAPGILLRIADTRHLGLGSHDPWWQGEAITNDAGVAIFEGVRPGPVQVLWDDGQCRTAPVFTGEAVQLIEIESVTDTSGRVINRLGEPVPKAEVWISSNRFGSPGIRMASTDDDGQFHFRTAGLSEVEVWAVGKGYAPTQIHRGHLAGRIEPLELEVEVATGCIRGTVRFPPDLARGSVRVFGTRCDGSAAIEIQGRVALDGTFTIEGLVPHARYAVVAIGPQESSGSLVAKAQTSHVVLELCHASRLEGSIRTDIPEQLPHLMIGVHPASSVIPHRIALRRLIRAAVPTAGGSFVIDNAPSGSCTGFILHRGESILLTEDLELRQTRSHVWSPAITSLVKPMRIVFVEPKPSLALWTVDSLGFDRALSTIRIPEGQSEYHLDLAANEPRWVAVTDRSDHPFRSRWVDLDEGQLDVLAPQLATPGVRLAGVLRGKDVRGSVRLRRVGVPTSLDVPAEDGKFAFTQLAGGQYRVEFLQASGLVTTLRDVLIDHETGVDLDLGELAVPETGTVTLANPTGSQLFATIRRHDGSHPRRIVHDGGDLSIPCYTGPCTIDILRPDLPPSSLTLNVSRDAHLNPTVADGPIPSQSLVLDFDQQSAPLEPGRLHLELSGPDGWFQDVVLPCSRDHPDPTIAIGLLPGRYHATLTTSWGRSGGHAFDVSDVESRIVIGTE